MAQSFSRYVDDLVLLLALDRDRDINGIHVDSGTGNARKILDRTSTTLLPELRKALLGLHAFSGNDYISAISKKEKLPFGGCWKRGEIPLELLELR